MKDNYLIEKATLSDFDEFYKCFCSIVEEEKFFHFVKAPSKAGMSNFFEKSMKNEIPFFVAKLDNNVIGWIDVRPYYDKTMSHNAELATGLLYDYRGKGIGRELIKAAIKESKKKGVEFLRLKVLSSNLTAIKFYVNNGFVEEGRQVGIVKISNRIEDFILMYLEI